MESIFNTVFGFVFNLFAIALLLYVILVSAKITGVMRLKSPLSAVRLDGVIKELTVYKEYRANSTPSHSYNGCVDYSYSYDGKPYETTCPLIGISSSDLKKTANEMIAHFPDQKITFRKKDRQKGDSKISSLIKSKTGMDISSAALNSLKQNLSGLEKPTSSQTVIPIHALKRDPRISIPSSIIDHFTLFEPGLIFAIGIGAWVVGKALQGFKPEAGYFHGLALMVVMVAVGWVCSYTPILKILWHNPTVKNTETILFEWADTPNTVIENQGENQ